MTDFVKARDGRYWRRDAFESFIIFEKNGKRYVIAKFPDPDKAECDFDYDEWFGTTGRP